VDSNVLFLNGRLARHYGIAGVDGVRIRRVERPAGSLRGGLLTQASVLTVTANGTTTSPVLRGAWVLDRLLGMPSPPPPEEVPAVEPDVRGTVTIREQLAKHRAQPSCAGCHAKIDPPGFALENFDVLGGWRDRYRSLGKGDAAAAPADGLRIRYLLGPRVDTAGGDVREFKSILLRDPKPLARNLVERLIVYATGSGIRVSDRPVVDAILSRTRAGGYGFRSLIHEVARSRIFLTK
jgi:hypothetical protein